MDSIQFQVLPFHLYTAGGIAFAALSGLWIRRKIQASIKREEEQEKREAEWQNSLLPDPWIELYRRMKDLHGEDFNTQDWKDGVFLLVSGFIKENKDIPKICPEAYLKLVEWAPYYSGPSPIFDMLAPFVVWHPDHQPRIEAYTSVFGFEKIWEDFIQKLIKLNKVLRATGGDVRTSDTCMRDLILSFYSLHQHALIDKTLKIPIDIYIWLTNWVGTTPFGNYVKHEEPDYDRIERLRDAIKA